MKNGLPRLYPILDTGALARRGCADWALVARGMLAGGAEILQIRHKEHWSRIAFAQAETIAEECRTARAELVINDRADMARLLQAGVHVGQHDLVPADVRAVVGSEPLLGLSTHDARQLTAAAAEPVDYLAFGPVFSTASKQNPDPVAGLEKLAHARSLTAKPLVAIGGITRHSVESVLATGVDAVAVIGDLLPDTLSEPAVRTRMEEWKRLLRK